MIYKKQWNLLNNALKLGRLSHALLFYGQKGLGKKDFALDFAKHLLGGGKENIHPDFILLDSAEEIKISRIKDLIKKLSFKPYSAPCKIAVINNAHLMNKEAQNCFLKFLEEPGEKTHLILITQYPDLLLPTILSRVQKIRFYPAGSFKPKEDEELISDIIKISQSDLAERFKTAKDLADQNLEKIFDEWLLYFRKIFISKIKGEKIVEFDNYSLREIKEIIKQIQITKFVISSTNTSPRLALEVLFMKI